MIKIDPRDKGPMNKNVGRRLAEIREMNGLSHVEMGNRLGLKDSQSVMSMYENGQRAFPPDLAVKMWVEFQVTSDWLYRGDSGYLPPDIWQKIRAWREQQDAGGVMAPRKRRGRKPKNA